MKTYAVPKILEFLATPGCKDTQQWIRKSIERGRFVAKDYIRNSELSLLRYLNGALETLAGLKPERRDVEIMLVELKTEAHRQWFFDTFGVELPPVTKPQQIDLRE